MPYIIGEMHISGEGGYILQILTISEMHISGDGGYILQILTLCPMYYKYREASLHIHLI